jgi:hypothetical protein
MLCVNDFDASVLGIYNRDHNHWKGLFDHTAGCNCRPFTAERTLRLTIHAQQKTLFYRPCLTLGPLSSGHIWAFRQRRSREQRDLRGSVGY